MIINLYKLKLSTENKMKKISIGILLFLLVCSSNAYSDQPKSLGKYKSWEAFTYNGNNGKICLHCRF